MGIIKILKRILKITIITVSSAAGLFIISIIIFLIIPENYSSKKRYDYLADNSLAIENKLNDLDAIKEEMIKTARKYFYDQRIANLRGLTNFKVEKQLNKYSSVYELPGVCSDYAVDLSVRTGAYLVVVCPDTKIMVYSLKEIPNNLALQYNIDVYKRNEYFNMFGFPYAKNYYYYIKAYNKYYLADLIETYDSKLAHGPNHAWNQVNDMWIDATWADVAKDDMELESFIWKKGTKLTVREEKP